MKTPTSVPATGPAERNGMILASSWWRPLLRRQGMRTVACQTAVQHG